MAWSDFYPLNQESINKVPKTSGVYQLNSDSGVLYFGQSDNLNRRLEEHLNSSDSCIQRATNFCHQKSDDPEGLESRLLKNYRAKHDGESPPCND